MTTTADLKPCNVALVRRPLGRDGASVIVEKHVAPFIDRIQVDYLADERSKRYPIRSRDTGAYNCRRTTSGSSWSKHAYGCAIDVNWSTNGYGASHHDIPAWLVAIFRFWGFGWGGNWSGTKDWMHFSKFPNEGGDGKLDPPLEEDDIPYTPKELTDIVEAVVAPVKAELAEVKAELAVVKGYTSLRVVKVSDPAGTPSKEVGLDQFVLDLYPLAPTPRYKLP